MKLEEAERIAELLHFREQIVEWCDDTIMVDEEADARPFIVFQEIAATETARGDRTLYGWQGELTLPRALVVKMLTGARIEIERELEALGVTVRPEERE